MSIASFCGISPGSLKLPSATNFEPSGLTTYSDSTDPWIFAVGDSGQVIKAKINHCRDGHPDQTSWHGPTTISDSSINVSDNASDLKPNDFESVTFANGRIMLGVEGDRTSDKHPNPTCPKVLRFGQDDTSNEVGTLTGSTWDLNGITPNDKTNAGMEAMTFIPSGSYPSAWASSTHYGGVFVVATQAETCTAYVYNLADGNGGADIASSPVNVSTNGLSLGALEIPQPGASLQESKLPKISEFCFDASRGYLWVLYDGGSSKDYLQALSLDPTTGSLTEMWSSDLPWMGVEGMAIDGNDLYIAIDNNDSTDGVYLLSGFTTKISFSSGAAAETSTP